MERAIALNFLSQLGASAGVQPAGMGGRGPLSGPQDGQLRLRRPLKAERFPSGPSSRTGSFFLIPVVRQDRQVSIKVAVSLANNLL